MILNVILLICFLNDGRLPITITPRDSVVPVKSITGDEPSICGTFIAPCGDIRAILGPQGKNIAVCRHGDAIAVLYGAPTGIMNDPMAVKIAYSTNQGATWQTYGPFTDNLCQIYGGCDGTPDFCTNPGECVFCHMTRTSAGGLYPEHVLIEENIPSNPLISVPITPYWSESLYIWQTGIAIAPDDPMKMITHGWSIRDRHLYTWVSTDGGYTWPAYVDMGVIINPAYGGNCPPKLRWGTGGYVAGIYNNSVGGITNDGWPYFIESTDNGATWLPPVALPVPQFDSTAGMFWWTEIDAEVVNNTPWVLANDFYGGFWVFKGNGTPGAWTWTAYDLGVLGACSTFVADTLYQMKPSQYASICHDPISGMTLITYKAYGYIVQGSTNVIQNGPCVDGVFTMDNGNTWKITKPLSVYQTSIAWVDWNATETAHRLANIGGSIYAYTIWINSTDWNLYFEGGTTNNGQVIPLWPNVAEASLSIPRIPMQLKPSVGRGLCRIEFTTATPTIADLTLFDVTGQQVTNLFKGRITAGLHTVIADISCFTAGVYFLKLSTEAGSQVRKIIRIK